MTREKVSNDEAGKTVALIALGNVLLAPLYAVDTRLGLTTALVATSAFLYGAHEIGKKRRPIENGINNIHRFFGGKREIETAIKNITAGTSAIFDELLILLKEN